MTPLRPLWSEAKVLRTHRPMMRVLLSCVLCWVAACSDVEEGTPLRDPNRAPEVGYIITMTLKDAPGLFASSIVASGSDTRYFWKERYLRVQDYDAYPEFSDANLDKVPLDRRGEFFTITLKAEGVES